MGERSRRRNRTQNRNVQPMIPYIALPQLSLPGGLSAGVFLLTTWIGVAAGWRLALKRGREAGVPPGELRGALLWILCSGFLGSHLVAIALYAPAELANDRLALFKIGVGMSSVGGFAGGLAGAFLYFRRLGRQWLTEAGILTEALVLGWIFGRLGCALVHDHVGGPTSFVLAIRFPAGVFHDLGWYEFLFTLCVLWPVVRMVQRKSRNPGCTIAAVCLLYAPVRFGLDFLRLADPRYAALTPAQWGAAALAGLGIWMAFVTRTQFHTRIKRTIPVSLTPTPAAEPFP
jgi:phosphatidylglycerol:prolipoprotein diacylglycerol transferase